MPEAPPRAEPTEAIDAEATHDGETRAPAEATEADPGLTLAPTEGGDPPPVRDWDRYELQGLLGEGGMGRVFKAWDPRLRRHVAIKFLSGGSAELKRRFLAEAQAQARVQHEAVCGIHEVGEVQGQPFIAMPFVAGETLDVAARSLSLEQKVRVVMQVAEGLHAAHRLGLIHRDVKPGNIMVARAEDGTPRPFVMDFGLARQVADEGHTLTGSVVGTPRYMPPEQALGRVRFMDRRSDVYSLGATLHAILADRPPFDGDSAVAILHNVLHTEPPPLRRLVPGFPADLETIVLKCLEKDPERRYDSARALADDLGRFLDGDPISARAQPLHLRLRRQARRHPALATLAVAALAFAGWAGWARWQTRQRTALAQALGQQVKELEVVMRYAALSPLHDVSRERAIVRRRMAQLQRDLAGLGDAGEGPAAYALGRGALELGQLDEARRQLERARRLGQDTPEVAYALGETLARLYERDLRRLATAGTEAERAQLKRTIDAELLAPALASLRRASEVKLDAPEYLEALVAYLGGDYPAAQKRAAAALQRAPWLAEAEALRGHALRRQAETAGDRGDATAGDLFAQSEQAFGEAIRIGPSHPAAHTGLCVLLESRLSWEVGQGNEAAETLQRAGAACAEANAVDPDDALAWLKTSDVLWRRVERSPRTGESPEPLLAAAIRAAERTLPSGYDLPYAHDNLGIVHAFRADLAASRGEDPGPDVERALAHFETALRLAPRFLSSRTNLSIALGVRARWEAEHGRSPLPDLERALRSLDEGLRVRPNSFLLGSRLACLRDRAAWELRTGADPSPTFANSAPTAAAWRAEERGDAWGDVNLAELALLQARWQSSRGEPAADALRACDEALARARRQGPQDPALLLASAERAAFGRAPGAATAFDAAVQSDPRNPRTLLRAARHRLDSGDAATARRLAGRATAINPELGEAWLVQGLAGRALGDPQAAALIERGQRLDPNAAGTQTRFPPQL